MVKYKSLESNVKYLGRLVQVKLPESLIRVFAVFALKVIVCLVQQFETCEFIETIFDCCVIRRPVLIVFIQLKVNGRLVKTVNFLNEIRDF